VRRFTVRGTSYEMGVQTAKAFLPYLERVRGQYEERIGLPGVLLPGTAACSALTARKYSGE